jgi:L-lactate dehydrogenase
MKVAIIGGGGLVGSCAAFALQCGGIVRELALVDVNADLAAGHALDLIHGSSSTGDQKITGGGMEVAANADMYLITAGLRRKPEESRLDLINRNVELFKKLLADVKAHGLKKEAHIFVVSNPVDVLTYLAVKDLGLPPCQVYGLGTVLDTNRLRGLLADSLQLPPSQVQALILGEHGDSMVPVWSAAQAAGLPLDKYPGVTPMVLSEIEKRTRGSGAEVIKKKGGAGFAVGIAIRDVIHAVALNSGRILPVSSLMTGQYGVRDVCFSVPTVMGRAGVLKTYEIELWPKEKMGLQASARVLRETIDKVLK